MLWAREAAVPLILILAALGVAPVAHADAFCDAAAPATTTKTLQDDADAGQDAGDAPDEAVPLVHDGYYWGWVDPVERDAADREDWYAVELPGDGRPVMFRITSNESGYYAGGVFRLDAYAPGAPQPTYTTDSLSPQIRFENQEGGVWHLRITAADAQGARACAATGDEPAPLGAPTGLLVRNHGVYFGCNPVCAPASAAR